MTTAELIEFLKKIDHEGIMEVRLGNRSIRIVEHVPVYWSGCAGEGITIYAEEEPGLELQLTAAVKALKWYADYDRYLWHRKVPGHSCPDVNYDRGQVARATLENIEKLGKAKP